MAHTRKSRTGGGAQIQTVGDGVQQKVVRHPSDFEVIHFGQEAFLW
jgi:hypothetical protein